MQGTCSLVMQIERENWHSARQSVSMQKRVQDPQSVVHADKERNDWITCHTWLTKNVSSMLHGLNHCLATVWVICQHTWQGRKGSIQLASGKPMVKCQPQVDKYANSHTFKIPGIHQFFGNLRVGLSWQGESWQVPSNTMSKVLQTRVITFWARFNSSTVCIYIKSSCTGKSHTISMHCMTVRTHRHPHRLLDKFVMIYVLKSTTEQSTSLPIHDGPYSVWSIGSVPQGTSQCLWSPSIHFMAWMVSPCTVQPLLHGLHLHQKPVFNNVGRKYSRSPAN